MPEQMRELLVTMSIAEVVGHSERRHHECEYGNAHGSRGETRRGWPQKKKKALQLEGLGRPRFGRL